MYKKNNVEVVSLFEFKVAYQLNRLLENFVF